MRDTQSGESARSGDRGLGWRKLIWGNGLGGEGIKLQKRLANWWGKMPPLAIAG
ncbi:hypothetical protein LKK83_08845 [Phormidium sp. CCY1219]|nr:hypothetical protein [Phormidium sp. CCY1219]